MFAGRDASKALGKSSMKPEDLSADYSELTELELKVLDDWVAYYTKVRMPKEDDHFPRNLDLFFLIIYSCDL